MELEVNLTYRQLIIDISAKLPREMMKGILFVCKSMKQLTKRDLEVDDPVDFFSILEERGLLSSDNMNFLKDILGMVHCMDGLQLIKQYEADLTSPRRPVQAMGGQSKMSLDSVDSIPVQGRGNCYYEQQHGRGPVQQETEKLLGEDLSEAFDFVVEEIGRDWRHLARKLGLTETDIDVISEDHVRNLREQSRQSLILWKRRYRENATKSALIDALRRGKMMYIADRLDGYEFQ